MIRFYYDPILGLVWWDMKPPFVHKRSKKKTKQHEKK
jgi:hypothetical protein